MKKTQKADMIWSIVLMAVPLLALLIGMIPGSIRLYDPETHAIGSYMLLSAMPSDMMDTTVPLIILLPLYASVLAFCYMRSQKINTLKAFLVFVITSVVVAWIPLLVEPNLQMLPYIVIPLVLTLGSVLAFVRYKIEDANYEY